MLLALALIACTDPAKVAVAACQALPGIAAHPEDLPMFEALLSAKDMEALRKASPTEGLKKVSAASLAAMRGKTSCTAGEVNGAGSGRWAVQLHRSAPTVLADGREGPVAEQDLEWQVVDEEGGRAELNLEGAAIARKNLDDAIEKEDFKRYAGGWKSLAGRWADPLLTVDVAVAEALLERMEYGKQLQHVFVGAADGEVLATVSNPGSRSVAELKVNAVFESSGGPVHSEATIGPLPAGGTLEYRLPIPEQAEGNVRLRTLDLRFVEP